MFESGWGADASEVEWQAVGSRKASVCGPIPHGRRSVGSDPDGSHHQPPSGTALFLWLEP